MSRGKYSPNLPKRGETEFKYNCFGQEPAPYKSGAEYDVQTMFGNYDAEGFDSYGYSCFDSEGQYVGIGNGIDRNGYTEFEYLTMDDDTWFNL